MMTAAAIPPAFHNLLERVRQALPTGVRVYLVGGAVRDLLLGRVVHDLDFAIPGDGLATGRKVANTLGAAFYPLDEERDTARVILSQPNGSRLVLDFATLRGPDLESDLLARDFTINAIALPVDRPDELIDPLHGAKDLRLGRLRACSPTSFQDDPVRILRGVRLAADFRFNITPETRQWMRLATGFLARVSVERLRDELFRILDGPRPTAALRILDRLEALSYVLPELASLKGVTQSPPHVSDVWNHTLGVLTQFRNVLSVLALQADPDAGASLALGLISLRLGRYREQIHAHMATVLNPDRSLPALLSLAALYHDIAKPQTRHVDDAGRVRFFEHDQLGAQVVSLRAQHLHLSNDEIERLKVVVRHHMRPLLLAQDAHLPSSRAVYRFFRDCGPAGVDICLLSLADVLATYGPTLPPDLWAHHLDVVRTLLEAWWEQSEQVVSPPALINGHDLMTILKLNPGPDIGRILEAVREAQAIGQVQTREQALDLARIYLDPSNNNEA